MNQRQKQAKQTYENILSAAKELAQNTSYENLSVDQICEHAGISKGGFYHHFSSKDQLISLLFGCQLGALLSERITPYLQEKDAFSLLKIYIDTVVKFLNDKPKDTIMRCWLMLSEHSEATDLDTDFCHAFIHGTTAGIVFYGITFCDPYSLQSFATESLELIYRALSPAVPT